MTDSLPPPDPTARYRVRGEEARQEAERLDRRCGRLSNLRMAAFLVAVLPLVFLENLPSRGDAIALTVAGFGSLAFLFFLVRHRRAVGQLRQARLRERIASEGEARIGRRWAELPAPPLTEASPEHPCAEDLNLVGWGSLAHLIGRVNTAPGRSALRRLLLDPFAPVPLRGEELLESVGGSATPTEAPDGGGAEWQQALGIRQDSVRVLAKEWEWRERFELLARSVDGVERPEDARAFLSWAREQPWLEQRKGLRWLARLLAFGTPLTLLGWIYGWVPGIIPLVGIGTALGLHQRYARAIHPRFDAAEGGEGALRRWVGLFRQMEAHPLAERFPAPGASAALRSLQTISDWAAIRRSALGHFPLVTLFAWDLHLLDRLERWQRRHGPSVSGWILSLGEVEAITALAGLTHDHPDWSFPDVSEDPTLGISAKGLGHPLLPPARSIPNDVELPGTGRLLLVTGSNMAGKTTLIRALGVNQILALAGAPVAASGFRTGRVLPWTTISVRDNLEEGVSLFLAELQRLRRVVDAAERGPVLYLLDEILHGTNSAERQTAARIVLERLLGTRSIGAVTTHDLALADTPTLQERSVQVHFRESVTEEDGKRILSFDYRLRPGPATSRNALLLLELVGLGPSDEAREGPRSPEAR